MNRTISKVALAMGLALMQVAGGELVLIANSGVKTTEISAADLKGIYLGTKTTLPDGTTAEPVLQTGAAHEAFLKDVVGKTDVSLKNHYKNLVFTGKGSMPKSFASDAEVAAYVAKTKGAVGYVGSAASAAGVKTVVVR
jgi:ABC-type phosphate transport system substrate-binding protein